MAQIQVAARAPIRGVTVYSPKTTRVQQQPPCACVGAKPCCDSAQGGLFTPSMDMSLDMARRAGSRSLDTDAGKQVLGLQQQDGSAGVPRQLFSVPPTTTLVEDDFVVTSIPGGAFDSVGETLSSYAKAHPFGAAILTIAGGVALGQMAASLVRRFFGGR